MMRTIILVTSLLSLAAATPPTPRSTCPASPFGIARNALNVRGGEVIEPETLEDVESILIKAGASNQLVVIDFSATWCGPCKAIAPLFSSLSDEMQNVVFLKVDVDDNPDTAAKYSVSAMPTFLFIKGGTVVDRLMGANPSRLQELIDQHK
jgi:thioredoxin 1